MPPNPSPKEGETGNACPHSILGKALESGASEHCCLLTVLISVSEVGIWDGGEFTFLTNSEVMFQYV